MIAMYKINKKERNIPKRVLHTTCDHQVQIKFPLSAGKPSLREKHSKQITHHKPKPIQFDPSL